MATLQATINRILDELNRSDLNSQAAAAVSSAIAHYGNESFGFNDTLTSTVVVAGTVRVPLPDDFINEQVFSIDSDSRRCRLEKCTWSDYQDRFDTLTTGEPSSYVLYGDYIYLWPIPDESYSFVLSYTCSLPELTVSASNAWTTECEEMIRMRAEADLLENIIRGEDAVQQAIVCRVREKEAYQAIQRKRTLQQSTRIKRGGML